MARCRARPSPRATSRPLILLDDQFEDLLRLQAAEVLVREPVEGFLERVPHVLRHRTREQELTELRRSLRRGHFRPSTPSITIPRPRTIWKACADGLWRLFRHFTMFRSRDGFAWSLLNFRWTTQSARYIGITVSGPARSPGPCSSSVHRTVPTFRVCLNM